MPKMSFSTTDPRNRRAQDVKVGDVVRGSEVRSVKRERKGGREGLRIRLADRRAAWMRPEARVMDAEFRLPAHD